jgi:pyruvate/2-oxoglutarate dehydrogenase complex dihydrolipoamide dehydrogenase (E3) component
MAASYRRCGSARALIANGSDRTASDHAISDHTTNDHTATTSRRQRHKASMAELFTPDICIIGGGPAGRAAAAAAAAFGVAVVLVEKGRLGEGGERSGTLPIASLRAAAKRARAIVDAPAFGITASDATIDFTAVRNHMLGAVAAVAPNASKERFVGLGVHVIEGVARFKDRRSIQVGDGIEIRARHFIVATGALPAVLKLPGLEETPHFTDETIFELVQVPEHLIVIGANATGLELAQAFCRLGAMVTVLDSGEPLWREDSECVRTLLDQLGRDGVVIRSGAAIASVRSALDKVLVVLADGEEETIKGSHLLLTTGRSPNVADLKLDKARIKHDRWGIVVDKALRTSNERVYAIGDVAGGLQFTHAGRYHAGLAVQNALFERALTANSVIIPRVTYTDPELAQVGITEDEARRTGQAFRILRWPFRENDRAVAGRLVHGHVKVVVRPDNRILGVTMVGDSASELIGAWCLAMSQGLTIDAVAGTILPYPTLSEVGSQALMTYVTPSSSRSWFRSMIRSLRRTG